MSYQKKRKIPEKDQKTQEITGKELKETESPPEATIQEEIYDDSYPERMGIFFYFKQNTNHSITLFHERNAETKTYLVGLLLREIDTTQNELFDQIHHINYQIRQVQILKFVDKNIQYISWPRLPFSSFQTLLSTLISILFNRCLGYIVPLFKDNNPHYKRYSSFLSRFLACLQPGEQILQKAFYVNEDRKGIGSNSCFWEVQAEEIQMKSYKLVTSKKNGEPDFLTDSFLLFDPSYLLMRCIA